MEQLDVMRIINAQNLRGCDDQPQKEPSKHRLKHPLYSLAEPCEDCKRLCKVIADVPEGSPPDTVWIQQVNSDKA